MDSPSSLVTRTLELSQAGRTQDALDLLDAQSGPDGPLTQQLAGACRAMVLWRQAADEGRNAEGLGDALAALETLAREGHDAKLDVACSALGFSLALVGDLQAALRYVDRGMAMAQARGDEQAQRVCRRGRGGVLAVAGLREQAIEVYRECLAELPQDAASVPGRLALLNNMAYCCIVLALACPPDDARRQAWARQALERAREAMAALTLAPVRGHHPAWSHSNEGAALTLLGDYPGAEAAFAAAWPSAQANARVLQTLTVHRARLLSLWGRPDEARRLLEQAEAQAQASLLDPTVDDLLECRLTTEIRAGAAEAAEHWAARRFEWLQQRHRVQIQTVRHLVDVFQRLEQEQRAERERSERQLAFWRDEALRDPLSGVLNRRGLQAAAGTLRPERGCALLLMDLDLFKRINDGFGHAVGDRVIAEAARLMQSALREGDLLARVGGEEFCAVLEGCAMAQALKVADKLRDVVARFDWTGLAPGLAATVSVGVSAGTGSTVEALMAAADQRLYEAKAAGRNCVR